MFFEDEDEYLNWCKLTRESYLESNLIVKYSHYIPYILTEEEFTNHFTRITKDNYKDGEPDRNPS